MRRVLMLTAVALTLLNCRGTPTELPDETGTSPEPVRLEASTSRDTVRLLQDTLRLVAALYGENGQTIDTAIRFRSLDTARVRVNEAGEVWAPADSLYVDEHGRFPLAPDSLPVSPGPMPVGLVAEGAGLADTVHLVRSSPLSWVNLHPDGVCQLADGTYTNPETGDTFSVDGRAEMWVEARDFIGRREPLPNVRWSSLDSSLVGVRVLERFTEDSLESRAEYHAKGDGITHLTARVASITDSMFIESSDSINAVGVVCDGSPVSSSATATPPVLSGTVRRTWLDRSRDGRR